jgi:6-phosphogluconate dehydrogenase (decarboxylating)
MQLGMIGLGRIGANMIRRLLKDGRECVLKAGTTVFKYEPDTWGPTIVEQMVMPQGGWHDPVILK